MRALLLLPILACDPKDAGSCETEPLDGATATVDGAAWTAAEVGWKYACDGVQIISTSEGAGWFSVVAQITSEGGAPADALAAGAFPVEVTLKTGPDGGFATWYDEEEGAIATTQGGGGTLVLSALDGGALTGCLSFTAGADGAGVSVEDGRFTAEEI